MSDSLLLLTNNETDNFKSLINTAINNPNMELEVRFEDIPNGSRYNK